MSRATTNKLYRTFVKGMNTEAGPLTYPEDATISESNCVLYQSGQRSRRLGFTSEPLETTVLILPTDPSDLVTTEWVWKSVNNDPTMNFTVVQVGRYVTFFDNDPRTISSTKKPYTVDLNTYDVTGTGVDDMGIQFASGKGLGIITGPKIDPILLTYSTATLSVVDTRITIQVRDFDGVNDGLANDEEPTTLDNPHKYNLMNQGWLDPDNTGSGSSVQVYGQWGEIFTSVQPTSNVINQYFTQFSRYPGNNKQWWIAKDATTGAFDAALLATFFLGANRAPRGHYILNAFTKDRSDVSDVSGLAVDVTSWRPTSCAFSNGRVWYAGGSSVWFSQILSDPAKIGMCYQEADPTSETISDLIGTDGGVVQIPEAASINRLIPIAGGIMVFATNGLWFITGSAGFSAVDVSVSKVTPVGTTAPLSIVHVQDANTDLLMYWTKVGIIGLQQRAGQFGKIDGQFDTSVLTQTTIQTFYNQINVIYHPYIKAHYDPSTNLVQWLFNSGECIYQSHFDSILNFDLTLKAFYPWRVTRQEATYGPYLSGIFQVGQNTGLRNGFTKYLFVQRIGAITYYNFGEENQTDFLDWNTQDYSSYLETGYELLEDAMRYKQALFVYTYLKRTETMYVADGDDWTVDKPSSLTMTVKWDWSSSTVANRWSTPVQVYRHTRIPMHDPDVSNVFDTGFPLVVTRHKVRGHGRSIQFRFENNESGKDFVLYGWAVPYSGNTNP